MNADPGHSAADSPDRQPPDAGDARGERCLGRLTFRDIEARLRPNSVVCLPVGAFEQHGPHLPLHTDVVLAEGFARAVVRRWGEEHELWSLPPLPFGLSREHGWASGTLSLSVESYSALLLDLCSSIARSLPAKNLLIINGHGGNRGILEALIYEFRERFGLRVCVTHPSALSQVRSQSPVPEVHGGKSETSIMLALAPEQVHLDRLTPRAQDPQRRAEGVRRFILDRAVTWPWSSDDERIADAGVIGDALSASRELGEAIVQSAVEEHGRVLRMLRDG